MLPLFATDAVLEIDAVVDPGADMAAFLDELAWTGVYLIARQVVFLDTRLGRSDIGTAILTPDGLQLRDDVGLGWTTPVQRQGAALQHRDRAAGDALLPRDPVRLRALPGRALPSACGDDRRGTLGRGGAVRARGRRRTARCGGGGIRRHLRRDRRDSAGGRHRAGAGGSDSLRRLLLANALPQHVGVRVVRPGISGGAPRAGGGADDACGARTRARVGSDGRDWCDRGCRTIATISRAGCTTASTT